MYYVGLIIPCNIIGASGGDSDLAVAFWERKGKERNIKNEEELRVGF